MRNLKVVIFIIAFVVGVVIVGTLPEIVQSQESVIIAREIYEGKVSDCNAGVVTTIRKHLNCATQSIGFTVSKPSDGIPLFVGITPNVNDGVVSTNPSHLGGKTRPIGSTIVKNTESYSIYRVLYVGKEDGCNAGVVTTNFKHLGCSTYYIGGTYHP